MLTVIIVLDLTNSLVKFFYNYTRFTVYWAICFFSVCNIFAIKLKTHSLKARSVFRGALCQSLTLSTLFFSKKE